MRHKLLSVIIVLLLGIALFYPNIYSQSAGRRHHHTTFVVVGGGFWFDPFWGWWWDYPPPHQGFAKDYGLIRCKVKPKTAIVFLDGKEMGIAKKLDGFPHDLKVPLGIHEIEFRIQGFKTYKIRLMIKPGFAMEITHKLESGEGIEEDNLVQDIPENGNENEDRI